MAVHAHRTLTHTMLLQRVWRPERVGEGWLLRDVVKRLRRKLGDAAADHRYIITEPRVGYRMAMGEEEEQAGAEDRVQEKGRTEASLPPQSWSCTLRPPLWCGVVLLLATAAKQ